MIRKLNNPVFVTQPALPPLDEYKSYLEKIWDSRIITNNGLFHKQFEKELADYLGVKYISLFSNGTLALITALQALKITGEVITTPFSFVATTHALWWNNIKPVFSDIEPEYFCLDPRKIEAHITPQTTAILAVHVYGNPCNVQEIQRIADVYGLKVIYDAAHAFGVKSSGDSILNFGDMSILSFHATKTFNTIEGGAIVSHSEKMKQRIDYLKNFGFEDETVVIEPGINAKMNELQCAYGIVQLKYVHHYIEERKKISKYYEKRLRSIKGIKTINWNGKYELPFTYFPILVDEKEYGRGRDSLYLKLKEYNIFTRRYFYPLISQFPTYLSLPSSSNANLPVAKRISEQILCLPIYPSLSRKEFNTICDIVEAFGTGLI